jgi:hypothetical protein
MSYTVPRIGDFVRVTEAGTEAEATAVLPLGEVLAEVLVEVFAEVFTGAAFGRAVVSTTCIAGTHAPPW